MGKKYLIVPKENIVNFKFFLYIFLIKLMEYENMKTFGSAVSIIFYGLSELGFHKFQ